MSGDDVKVQAGVAKAEATTHGPDKVTRTRKIEIEITEPASGPEYRVVVPVPADAEPPTGPRPGPPPAITAARVDKARRELEAETLPSGERSIADRLGVSRGAVRHALGKDRR